MALRPSPPADLLARSFAIVPFAACSIQFYHVCTSVLQDTFSGGLCQTPMWNLHPAEHSLTDSLPRKPASIQKCFNTALPVQDTPTPHHTSQVEQSLAEPYISALEKRCMRV
jgi:hypothetical protein